MYSKPQLQRFGTLRELTRLGYEEHVGDGLWAWCQSAQLIQETEGPAGGEGPYLS